MMTDKPNNTLESDAVKFKKSDSTISPISLRLSLQSVLEILALDFSHLLEKSFPQDKSFGIANKNYFQSRLVRLMTSLRTKAC